jgi:RNA polymerase sigma factor (TIGR02999 family)
MSSPRHSDVTQLLLAWHAGDETARDRMMPLVYQELHDLARRYMAGEHTDHPLQATALVHEAYLKLVDTKRIRWQGRGHFLAVAAQAMRRILVDFARRRDQAKHAGGQRPITLDEELLGGVSPEKAIVAIHDALEALARKDPRKVRVIELRFFGGLSVEETAEALGVSRETVHRDWRLGRAWLRAELESTGSDQRRRGGLDAPGAPMSLKRTPEEGR